MTDAFSRYDIYTSVSSIYCYRDSNVLKNKYNIRDNGKLRAIETDISVIRQNDLLLNPIKGRFTPNHLCRIHRYLFGDIYSFAGYYRREDIMKGQTRFLVHSEVSVKLSELLNSLKNEKFLRGLDFEQFLVRSAHYFAELNYIHPFREGNGRATREFMRQLFLYNGYEVRWDAVSTETLLQAMELSVFKTDTLVQVLSRCLTEYA